MGKVPLLTAVEEVSLAKRIERHDMEAERKLIEANPRLVVSIAKRHIDCLYDEEEASCAGVYRDPAAATAPTAFTTITSDRGDVLARRTASVRNSGGYGGLVDGMRTPSLETKVSNRQVSTKGVNLTSNSSESPAIDANDRLTSGFGKPLDYSESARRQASGVLLTTARRTITRTTLALYGCLVYKNETQEGEL
jgi:hypothetical protein